jgi:hypothetical protein
MRRGGVIAVAAVVLAGWAAPAAARWHAVAGKLPPKYHLLETTTGDVACYGGVPRADVDEELSCDDNSLTIFTLGPGDSSGNIGYPDGPEHPVTIRGRRATWHWLTDEGYRFARELVWSPRTRLRVAVYADAGKLGLDELLYVGRHIRALRERDWKLLLRQTTYEAQEGRFEPGMTRVEVTTGTADGDPWRLDALLPPDYPLSENDLRPACLELVYRGEHGRGEYCYDGWERVAGHVFVFGSLPNSWRRYSVHFYRNVKGKRRGRTYTAPGWTRWKFFARPLPTETCDLFLTNPDNRDDYGGVYRPESGTADYERCGFGAHRQG